MSQVSTIGALTRRHRTDLYGTAAGYNPALDGLRGLAVLVVIGFHSALPFMPGGFLGVDLFFVLSGFLITRLLRAELASTDTIDVTRFYWRRALRLWPTLLAVLALYACFAMVLAEGTDVLSDVLLSGFYLTDYSYSLWRAPELLRHTWSLSVEQHFYLVWPLFILATRRLEARNLAILIALLYCVATGWRMVDYVLFSDWRWTYFRFDTRLSGLMLGAFLAVTAWKPTSSALGWTGALVLMVLITTMEMPSWFQFSSGTIAAELASAAVVMAAVHCRGSLYFKLLSWRPLVICGVLSYALYLVHYPLARILRVELAPLETFVFVAALSLVVAAVIHVAIERPMRGLRGRDTVLSTS